MTLEHYPEEARWARNKLHEMPGAFLAYFLLCCTVADAENYELLRPAVAKLMLEHPVNSIPWNQQPLPSGKEAAEVAAAEEIRS